MWAGEGGSGSQGVRGVRPPHSILSRVPTATGKMVERNSLSGKTQGIRQCCQKTGISFCSSCKFPDSEGKKYCDIFQKLAMCTKSIFDIKRVINH